MNEAKIRRLIKLVEESDIESLEIRPPLRTAIKITKSRTGNNGAPAGDAPMLVGIPATAPAQPPSRPATVPETPEAETSSPLVEIKAPLVGTFYRGPSPDAPPFVEVGQTIKPGDVLCIIEAMKLMNEIEAEHSGRIVAVKIDNADPVEFGQVLFTLDPTSG